MGAIFNAQANKTPLLVTAGQQARSLMTLQANLTNRDATRMPHPLVKWSYEPPRARGRAARDRARHLPGVAPAARPGVRVDPVRRLGRRGGRGRGRAPDAPPRRPGARAPTPSASGELVEKLAKAKNPAIVAGPDIDMCGGWDAAVKFAEKQKLPGLGDARAGRRAARLPGEPPALPRHPAARDRPRRRDAEGVRPRARRRLVGLPVLPEHPRAAAG